MIKGFQSPFSFNSNTPISNQYILLPLSFAEKVLFSIKQMQRFFMIKISNFKFQISNSKFKIQNSKFKIQNSKFKIQVKEKPPRELITVTVKVETNSRQMEIFVLLLFAFFKRFPFSAVIMDGLDCLVVWIRSIKN